MPYQSQKPVWWKIITGLVLILVEIKNHVDPASNVFKANNPGEQVGMYIAMVVLIAVGCWLVYSGVKPFWRKTE